MLPNGTLHDKVLYIALEICLSFIEPRERHYSYSKIIDAKSTKHISKTNSAFLSGEIAFLFSKEWVRTRAADSLKHVLDKITVTSNMHQELVASAL
jgi:hypothetical protein